MQSIGGSAPNPGVIPDAATFQQLGERKVTEQNGEVEADVDMSGAVEGVGNWDDTVV